MDIENCTITGNTVAYKLEDGEITSYEVENGKINEDTGKKAEEIELTNYQISILDEINKTDGNKCLSKKDLTELSANDLRKTLDELDELQECYEITSTYTDKNSAGVKLNDNNGNEKNISIEFEKKGFFKRICDSIINILKDLKKTEETIEVKFPTETEKTENIPKENNEHQKTKETQYSDTPTGKIAQQAGVSENFINDILFGLEGKSKEPVLTAYKDGVGANGGALTIGFGHTGEDVYEGQTISEEEAYQLLAQDILKHKEIAINYIGEEAFYNAPQSIQDGIIDLAFNKGSKAFNSNSPSAKLKEDLEKEDYASAVEHMIYATENKGLKKRNVYRCIMSMKDLSNTDRAKAMKNLEDYFNSTLALYKGTGLDEKLLTDAWENAKVGDCTDFFKILA